MSNKTLIIVILSIVIVSSATAGYFYWQNTKPLKGVAENIPQSEDTIAPTSAPASQSTDNASSTLANNNKPMDQNSDKCVRDFSSDKLKSNSSINIAGRQVEIDIKNFGKVTVQLYDKDAPKTVENFLRLTDSGYYDCLTFHRVAKDFVIQGGDPNGDGSGGQSAFGKTFADELNPDTASYKAGYAKGVLAMANSGANTNGSQFFIMLADNELPHSYTIFGKVISGQDVVDKIGQVDITPQMGATDGAPKVPVVMQSVKIVK